MQMGRRNSVALSAEAAHTADSDGKNAEAPKGFGQISLREENLEKSPGQTVPLKLPVSLWCLTWCECANHPTLGHRTPGWLTSIFMQNPNNSQVPNMQYKLKTKKWNLRESSQGK